MSDKIKGPPEQEPGQELPAKTSEPTKLERELAMLHQVAPEIADCIKDVLRTAQRVPVAFEELTRVVDLAKDKGVNLQVGDIKVELIAATKKPTSRAK